MSQLTPKSNQSLLKKEKKKDLDLGLTLFSPFYMLSSKLIFLGRLECTGCQKAPTTFPEKKCLLETILKTKRLNYALVAASVVFCMSILTLVILLLCCLLRVYDWCQENTNAIKQEAIELQLSGASNVNHLPNSFDRRPTIEI